MTISCDVQKKGWYSAILGGQERNFRSKLVAITTGLLLLLIFVVVLVGWLSSREPYQHDRGLHGTIVNYVDGFGFLRDGTRFASHETWRAYDQDLNLLSVVWTDSETASAVNLSVQTALAKEGYQPVREGLYRGSSKGKYANSQFVSVRLVPEERRLLIGFTIYNGWDAVGNAANKLGRIQSIAVKSLKVSENTSEQGVQR